MITGARGNLGGKLCAALASDHDLVRIDLAGGEGCVAGDVSQYDPAWVAMCAGADTILHFAGDPRPTASWNHVQRANIAGTSNVLRAAREHRVRRIVFASTNQVMAGYRFLDGLVTTALPPAPLNPYAVSKLFGEEAGRAFVAETGSSFIALRIGNIMPGANVPHAGMGIGLWGQQMWLSNRDFIEGVRAAIAAPGVGFAIVNLVSRNAGMRWDLDETERVLRFRPQDGFQPDLAPEDVAEDAKAREARLTPGSWLDQRFQPLRG
ncbi:MAG: NAD(P)-dependent oxidoreductase [Proteobacteria bacterium]|nr:NAD(P)-dependent oxidoreductase [Pseudomonadota bacterium]